MSVILALLAAVGAVLFWMYRARMAGQVAQELAGAAADVLNAARRLGFRRQANQHPAEGTAQPDLAIGSLAVAFHELDSLPNVDQQAALARSLSSRLGLASDRAEEIIILGRWMVTECHGPQAAIERLAKRLYRIDGSASLEPLMRVLGDVAQASRAGLSDRQKEALNDIARHLRIC